MRPRPVARRSGPVPMLTAVALLFATAALVTDTVFARPLSPAAFAGTDTGTGTGIAPRDLARWIRDGRPNLRVIDVRSPEAFDEYHIVTAENIPAALIRATVIRDGVTAIVYDEGTAGDDAAQQAQATLARAGVTSVLVLEGGVEAWTLDVMRPRLAADAKPAERREFVEVAELSRWFGGLPRVETAGESAASPTERARSVRRQGC